MNSTIPKYINTFSMRGTPSIKSMRKTVSYTTTPSKSNLPEEKVNFTSPGAQMQNLQG
jgi:hypothetical protein